MQSGAYTVGDSMRRHLVTLERERENLEAAAALCAQLAQYRNPLDTLDTDIWLKRMAEMEQEGTMFMNKQKQDTRKKRYVAPILSAVVMALLMAGCIWLYLWAFEVDPIGAPPLPLLALLIAMPAAVILGVVIALVQRMKELKNDEVEDAKKY